MSRSSSAISIFVRIDAPPDIKYSSYFSIIYLFSPKKTLPASGPDIPFEAAARRSTIRFLAQKYGRGAAVPDRRPPPLSTRLLRTAGCVMRAGDAAYLAAAKAAASRIHPIRTHRSRPAGKGAGDGSSGWGKARCNIDPWGFHLVVQAEGDDDVLRGAVLLFPHPAQRRYRRTDACGKRRSVSSVVCSFARSMFSRARREDVLPAGYRTDQFLGKAHRNPRKQTRLTGWLRSPLNSGRCSQRAGRSWRRRMATSP